MANNYNRELGSQKEFEVHQDGSISYFSGEVSDEVRAAAESERDRLLLAREEAAVSQEREVGTPEAVTVEDDDPSS